MPITFYIPGALREFTGGRAEVLIPQTPGTLADALTSLWAAYPGIRDRVVNEQGRVREHINIFIGNENSRFTGGLTSPIQGDEKISIVPAVSGG